MSSSSNNSNASNTNTTSAVQTGSATSSTFFRSTPPSSSSYIPSSHRTSQAPVTYRQANSNSGPRPTYQHVPAMPNNRPVAHGRPHGPRPHGGWRPHDNSNFHLPYYTMPFPMECAWDGGYPGFGMPCTYPMFMPMVPNVRAPPPPQPMLELSDIILKQVDYYFSVDNLVKDAFLRSRMDECGWVDIAIIASFPWIKQMNTEIPVILASLRRSSVVEVDGLKVRKRDEWSKWPLAPT